MNEYNYDRRRVAGGSRMDSKLRGQINVALVKAGLGGRRKFRKIGGGLNAAVGVLQDFGIEPDETLDAFMFPEAGGNATVDIAFSDPSNSHATERITNTVLALQWTELREDFVEVIAYLS